MRRLLPGKIFDGMKRSAYVEGDRPAPLNVYGRSKALMEQAISEMGGNDLIIRTAAFFSPFDDHNFAVAVARALARGERFAAVQDCVITPTYVPDLCDAALDLLIDAERGIWHLSNAEALSWADFARRLAEALGRDPATVEPVPARHAGWIAKRPCASPISSQRGNLLPVLQAAIDRFSQVFIERE